MGREVVPERYVIGGRITGGFGSGMVGKVTEK
jgi:hypothetical protein